MFDTAFEKWNTVLVTPKLGKIDVANSELVDDLMIASAEYYDMIRVTGRDWPIDFPFQDFIDARALQQADLRLPTSQDIADRESGRSDGDPDIRIRREREELAKARAEKANILEEQGKIDDPNMGRVRIYDGPDEDD